MEYLISIKTAIIVFPIIALLFTIPFILSQYHKYGSINKLRTLIIYSFILYMITIYFLVILPLPKFDDVINSVTLKPKLIPFSFVNDFIKETSLVITNPNTYLKALTEPCFYVVVFNIFMTIPFGMYLRYYYKCSFKKTVCFSFLLSLFFELTQLTGLYFIYPKAYRLFDVDDLILNTLGGIIGYFLIKLFKFLPTRDEIDRKSYEQGTYVSGLRRVVLFFLDLFVYLFVTILISIFIKTKYIMIYMWIIYYVVIPFICKGKTLGGRFLNVCFTTDKHLFIRLLFRNIFIYFYYFILPFTLFLVLAYFNYSGIAYLFAILGILLFYLINFIILIKTKSIFYDKMFKINYESTVTICENV